MRFQRIAAAAAAVGFTLTSASPVRIDVEVVDTVTVVETFTVIPVAAPTFSAESPNAANVKPGVFYSGMTASGSVYPSGVPTGRYNGTADPTGTGAYTGTAAATSFSRNFTLDTTVSVAFTPTASSPIILTTAVSSSLAVSSSSVVAPSSNASSTISTFSTSSTSIPSSIISLSSTPSLTTISTPILTPTPPSTSTHTSTSTSTAAPTPSSPGFLRGVNLGGWLVLEKWMNADLFVGDFASAVDQWTFDATPGAAAALQQHWATFFTEADFEALAATGINALRIPIGFWAYDNAGTPYVQGADAVLERAIGWARAHGLKVWVDCHGSPGSQNGFDNSGHRGAVAWQQPANLQRSTDVLVAMARKYGAAQYADVVVGLEMTNEPVSSGANDFGTTQAWAAAAYAAVAAVVENDALVVVMHDAFEGPASWTGVARTLNAGAGGAGPLFGVDQHDYQLYSAADNALDQAQHIAAACGWGAALAAANAVMPVYVGEWSAATNVCVNPDGSTTAGTSCSVAGCQCQGAPMAEWTADMKRQVRMFVEAQMDTFEASSSGYFMWSAKGPGGWGFLNGVQAGVVPNPVTERMYPGQCGDAAARRARRGALGVAGEKW